MRSQRRSLSGSSSGDVRPDRVGRSPSSLRAHPQGEDPKLNQPGASSSGRDRLESLSQGRLEPVTALGPAGSSSPGNTPSTTSSWSASIQPLSSRRWWSAHWRSDLAGEMSATLVAAKPPRDDPPATGTARHQLLGHFRASDLADISCCRMKPWQYTAAVKADRLRKRSMAPHRRIFLRDWKGSKPGCESTTRPSRGRSRARRARRSSVDHQAPLQGKVCVGFSIASPPFLEPQSPGRIEAGHRWRPPAGLPPILANRPDRWLLRRPRHRLSTPIRRRRGT